MFQPKPNDASPGPGPPSERLTRRASLAGLELLQVLEVALFLRIATAMAVEWAVRRRGGDRVCLFPDADYYWALAGRILDGRTYEIVEWGDIPHFAIRTPGYPLFLAICRRLLGNHPLGARLVQALLGTLSVWLVYRLSHEVMGEQAERPRSGRMSIPLLAAFLTAVHPYFLVMSALLLSEVVFVVLMLGGLWGLAVVWSRLRRGSALNRRTGLLLPFAIGVACGAAILVRPSWLLFLPIMLVVVLADAVRVSGHRWSRAGVALRVTAFVVVGFVAIMAPWWLRNAGVYGRFVPTALWLGASLYDGLNPRATGASDMGFLGDTEFWPLDELDQDRRLTNRAIEFAREHPRRVLELAILKLGKYWCPWPSAEGLNSWPITAAGTVWAVPLLVLMGLGLWDRRLDPRAWLLLAGPLLYFCGVHLIFASSMRYRLPGEVPAMGLAACGLARLADGSFRGHD